MTAAAITPVAHDAGPISELGAWFVIDIDSRDLPTDMAKVAAVHAADVLAEQGLEPLVKFSGSDGYHLMWDAPDLDGISDAELWELERAVVRAVAKTHLLLVDR